MLTDCCQERRNLRPSITSCHFRWQTDDKDKRKRDSEVSPKEQKSFTVAHRKFKDYNEDTLLCQLMPYLVNRDRKVPQSLVDRADNRRR